MLLSLYIRELCRYVFSCYRPLIMYCCPAQTFSPELAGTKNLKLHIVGAVYGAKLSWAEEHDGQEPPPHEVRPSIISAASIAQSLLTCN